jgi:hypothetical protein
MPAIRPAATFAVLIAAKIFSEGMAPAAEEITVP